MKTIGRRLVGRCGSWYNGRNLSLDIEDLYSDFHFILHCFGSERIPRQAALG